MEKTRAKPALKFLFTLLICGLIWTTGAAAAPSIDGRPEARTDHVGKILPHRLLTPSALAAPIFHSPPTTLKIILLRVDFPADSTTSTSGSGEWSDPAYASSGDSDYWLNKNRTELIDYYSEVSRGKLTLEIDISPAVYRLPDTMSTYGSETNAAIENLIADSVNKAKDAGLNLTGYDTIVIVHAGPGEEIDMLSNSSADIWSLYYDDSKISQNNNDAYPAVTLTDGTPVHDAILMPQTGEQDGTTIDPLGIYAHEFAHLIGLPDLYPTDWQSWAGPGEWCLMGAGLYNRSDSSKAWGSSPAWPSAWCRYYLGWEDAPLEQTVGDPDLGDLIFQAATTPGNIPGQIRLLKVPVTDGSTTNFFLVENRQKAGYDAGLYGHGLLIWKIDDTVINSNIALNSVNNTPLRPGVALLEADGSTDLMSWDSYADAGDTLPGSAAIQAITPTTSPASTNTSSGPGWFNLNAIDEVGETVTCTAGLGPDAVKIITAKIDNGMVEIEWDTALSGVGYNIYHNGIFIEYTTGTLFTEKNALKTDEYGVASVDADGNETLKMVTVKDTVPAAGSSSNGGCFIATAAFGSYEAPAVKTLRTFRDRVLLSTAPGRAFVAAYYQISPPLADFIATSPLLKSIVRIILLPLIGIAIFCVELNIVQQGTALLLLLGTLMTIWRLTEKLRLKIS